MYTVYAEVGAGAFLRAFALASAKRKKSAKARRKKSGKKRKAPSAKEKQREFALFPPSHTETRFFCRAQSRPKGGKPRVLSKIPWEETES